MSLRSEKITVTHFVWNQDEAAQNSREAKRFCNMSLHSAQTMRPLAVRVKPISFASWDTIAWRA